MSGCLIFVLKFVVAMQAADVAGLVVSGNVTLVSFSLLEIGSAVMTDATNLPLMIIHVNFKLTLRAANFSTDLANDTLTLFKKVEGKWLALKMCNSVSTWVFRLSGAF